MAIVAGMLIMCLSIAGCISSSEITGPTTTQQDPIIGTWIGTKLNSYGDYDDYTMVFNADGTGKNTVIIMGMMQKLEFGWTQTSNLNYKMNFDVACSGFSQTNALVLSSDGENCSIIGIKFTKS